MEITFSHGDHYEVTIGSVQLPRSTEQVAYMIRNTLLSSFIISHGLYMHQRETLSSITGSLRSTRHSNAIFTVENESPKILPHLRFFNRAE